MITFPAPAADDPRPRMRAPARRRPRRRRGRGHRRLRSSSRPGLPPARLPDRPSPARVIRQGRHDHGRQVPALTASLHHRRRPEIIIHSHVVLPHHPSVYTTAAPYIQNRGRPYIRRLNASALPPQKTRHTNKTIVPQVRIIPIHTQPGGSSQCTHTHHRWVPTPPSRVCTGAGPRA